MGHYLGAGQAKICLRIRGWLGSLQRLHGTLTYTATAAGAKAHLWLRLPAITGVSEIGHVPCS